MVYSESYLNNKKIWKSIQLEGLKYNLGILNPIKKTPAFERGAWIVTQPANTMLVIFWKKMQSWTILFQTDTGRLKRRVQT